MIPVHLSLTGFLSYRESAEIDFRNIDLACISGANGAGKSSLLDAFTWALFGTARKKDDSLINTRSDSAFVQLVFGYEGNFYRIQRSKKREKPARLEFQILQAGPEDEVNLDEVLIGNPAAAKWKPLTEPTMRETQAKIEQTLRMDYDTFVNASFFLQGKADQFAQHRPSERKRILGSILGLEIWDTYRDISAERRKSIEREISGIEGSLREIETELGEEEDRKKQLRQLENDLEQIMANRAAQEIIVENIRSIKASLVEQEKLVAALTRQLEGGEQRLQTIQKRIEERGKELHDLQYIHSMGEEIERAYQSWQEAKSQLEEWETLANQFRQEEKRREQPQKVILAERTRLEQELLSLLEDRKAFKTAQLEITRQKELVEKVQAGITSAETKLEHRKELDKKLQQAITNQAEARAENPRLKSSMDEIKERIEQLKAAPDSECPVCGQPLNPDERQVLIDSLTAQGTELGNRYRANNALVVEMDEKVVELSTQRKELEKVDQELRVLTEELAGFKTRLEVLEDSKKKWEDRYEPRLQEVKKSLEKELYAEIAQAELAQIEKELKSIGYDAAAHDAVRRAEKAGRENEAKMRALENARASLKPIKREIDELKTQADALEEELRMLREEQSTAAAALAGAQSQVPDLESAERDRQLLLERENRLTMEVGGARQLVEVLDDLRTRKAELQRQRDQNAKLVSQHQILERAFGPQGVPALLIEQALPQIEFKANQILEKLGGDMSVRFITQTEFKDKKRQDMRETLDIQISDGAGVRDYEMFSGGEAFRVNFSVRLALSEMLAQRAGARLQTLVIDEGFGTQDAQGRQRLIEAINTVRPDFAKILVITHIDELKDAFPARIEVNKTNQGSMVQVI